MKTMGWRSMDDLFPPGFRTIHFKLLSLNVKRVEGSIFPESGFETVNVDGMLSGFMRTRNTLMANAIHRVNTCGFLLPSAIRNDNPS